VGGISGEAKESRSLGKRMLASFCVAVLMTSAMGYLIII